MTALAPPDEWADPAPEEDPEGPGLQFPTVWAWFSEYWSPTYRRSFGNGAHASWCPWWWRHAEAVEELTGLWLSWEHQSTVPGTGMADWWRDYATPAMARLTDTRGPFARCSTEDHALPPALPGEPPPPGLFGPA